MCYFFPIMGLDTCIHTYSRIFPRILVESGRVSNELNDEVNINLPLFMTFVVMWRELPTSYSCLDSNILK